MYCKCKCMNSTTLDTVISLAVAPRFSHISTYVYFSLSVLHAYAYFGYAEVDIHKIDPARQAEREIENERSNSV